MKKRKLTQAAFCAFLMSHSVSASEEQIDQNQAIHQQSHNKQKDALADGLEDTDLTVSQTEEYIDSDSIKLAAKKGNLAIKPISAKVTTVPVAGQDAKKAIKPKLKIQPKKKLVIQAKKPQDSSLKVVSSKKVTKPSLVIAGAEDEPSLKEYGADQSGEQSPKQLSTDALLYSDKALTEEKAAPEKKKLTIKPKVAQAKKVLKISPKKSVSVPAEEKQDEEKSIEKPEQKKSISLKKVVLADKKKPLVIKSKPVEVSKSAAKVKLDKSETESKPVPKKLVVPVKKPVVKIQKKAEVKEEVKSEVKTESDEESTSEEPIIKPIVKSVAKKIEMKPLVKKLEVKSASQKKITPKKLEVKPVVKPSIQNKTASKAMPIKKKPQVKISAKPKSLPESEESTVPKEKSAVETKQDFRMNMQVEKDLEEAQTKFTDLSQIAQQTKSQEKKTVQYITQMESDAQAKTLEANNANMLQKISEQKAKADKKIKQELQDEVLAKAQDEAIKREEAKSQAMAEEKAKAEAEAKAAEEKEMADAQASAEAAQAQILAEQEAEKKAEQEAAEAAKLQQEAKDKAQKEAVAKAKAEQKKAAIEAAKKKVAEAQAKKKAEAERILKEKLAAEKKSTELAAQKKAEQEAAAKKKVEAQAKLKAQLAEAKKKSELEAKKMAEEAVAAKKMAEAKMKAELAKKAEEAKSKAAADLAAKKKASDALKKSQEDAKKKQEEASKSNEVPISQNELLGHHTQINQKLDESIEEKLKIEIKKDEEEENSEKDKKTQSVVESKRDEDILKDDDESDEHFDDLPFYENTLKESSRSYEFNHGYVAELLEKEDQLKKAKQQIDSAAISLKAERSSIDGTINSLIATKDDLEKQEEERHKKTLETYKLEEDEKHRILLAESRDEHALRKQYRDEAAKHEKRAEQLLEKQLELRKYDKTIHNSLDAVKLEKVKVQDEIEFAEKKAKQEHEYRLLWEKREQERLEKEKKYLEEEAARRKEAEAEEMKEMKLRTLQASCKEDKSRSYQCDDEGYRVVKFISYKYDLEAGQCIEKVKKVTKRCHGRDQNDDYVQEDADGSFNDHFDDYEEVVLPKSGKVSQEIIEPDTELLQLKQKQTNSTSIEKATSLIDKIKAMGLKTQI